MVKKGGFISNLNVIIKYLKSDLIKKQRSFKIGLVSVFLVVFFLTLLLNAIQLCPSIFIKLSEEQNSEIDLLLTPYLTRKNVDIKKSGFDTLIYNKISLTNALTTNYKINFNFLNFYEIKEKLENIPFIEGLSPRWIIQGKASNKNEKKKIFSEFLTNIIILDSSIENNIGIGRSLNLPTLQKNECYISTTLGNALKLDIGDIVQINIKLWDLIQAFEGGSPNEKEEEEYNKTIKDRIKLKDIYEKEDNISINNEKFYKDIFEPENDFHIGKKFFGSNRYKNVKNAILNSKPIKEIINIIANEIINKIINENINKLLKLINEYFPNNINLNDLSSFSVKKSELKNLMDLIVDENVKSIFGNMISNFTNMNNSRISSNINLIKNITNSLLKQTFTYNETTDLIEFNKTLLSISPKGNITNYIKYNLDYHKILEQYNKESSDPIFDEAFKFSNFKINLTVREKIKPTSGKWPSSLGNVLAIDCNYISDYLEINSKRLVEELGDSLNIESGKKIILNYTNKYIKNFDINKYALTINGIFKNKFEIYTKDRKDLKKYISKKASEITKFLGLNHQVNIELPLYKNIIYFEVLIIFLKVILMGIMFFLWILSVLLVYSLMLGNVDERTYESSMLRALGFKKNNLIFLIVIQGLFFAIPGTLLGLVSSYIANNYIAFLFNSYTKLVMPFFMSKSNLIFGIIIGISIPLISSYFPIKKVLNRNLKDSLTIFNKKIGDISISMIKLEKMGISPITLITSIILIVIGLLTYYVAPISFIFLNPKIFLFIMLGILITMLLGLIILTQLFVPYLQKFILKIIMFFSFKDRKLHLIVTKNLDGHKRRDMQISLMFMIALGFVIFSGCTLNLVVDFIETMAKNIIGGDFMIILTNKRNFNATLNQTSINGYLNNITNNYPNLIQDYAYISYPFEDIFLTKDHKIYPTLSTLNGFPDKQTRVYAIDKNFIDSSYTSLYSISQYDKKINKSYK